MKFVWASLVAILGLAYASTQAWVSSAAEEEPLLIYSSRQDHLIKPLFDLYREETGQKVQWVTGDAPVLIERLKREGARSKVDILMTVDAGNLWQAANLGLFDPISSSILEQRIPSHLRDDKNRWFGFSIRARTLVFNTERVRPEELTTYEDLAAAKWRGKLCLRTSKKVYNQSLVAMMIERLGEKEAERIVKGWVENLARPVFPNDTQLIQSIEQGECAVGIVNTYYYGRYQRDNPKTKVRIFWPDQAGDGVHVNISGAGVMKTSLQKAKAKAFLEWMSTERAQKVLADSNLEYPVVAAVPWDPIVRGWGEFVQDKMPMAVAGKNQGAAIRLMDRAGYR